MDYQNSVFWITSTENHGYGTGFVIYKDERFSYVLTCRHVVDEVDGPEKALVASHPVKGSFLAPDNSPVDLAVLMVESLKNSVPLKLSSSADSGISVNIPGFFLFDKKSKKYRTKLVEGILTDSGDVVTGRHGDRIRTWDINVIGKYLLQKGYSGSPLIDRDKGFVLGVVTHMLENGKEGAAVSIEALADIWPDMPKNLILLPNPRIAASNTGRYHDSETDNQEKQNLLPYLVDRDPQVYSLVKMVNSGKQAGLPKICLLHGDETQCLDKFIECLQFRRWREDIEPLNRNMADPRLILLHWPHDLDNEEEISNRIINSILAKLPRELHVSDKHSIYEAVNKSHKGALLICTIISSRQLKYKEEIIDQFIRFWSSWPSRGSWGFLVSCLAIKYPQKSYIKKFFSMFNRRYEKDFRNILVSRHSQYLIPELMGIDKDHADAWTHLQEVHKICIRKDLQPDSIIREIFKNQKIIPMETLAKELKNKFLKEDCEN